MKSREMVVFSPQCFVERPWVDADTYFSSFICSDSHRTDQVCRLCHMLLTHTLFSVCRTADCITTRDRERGEVEREREREREGWMEEGREGGRRRGREGGREVDRQGAERIMTISGTVFLRSSVPAFMSICHLTFPLMVVHHDAICNRRKTEIRIHLCTRPNH